MARLFDVADPNVEVIYVSPIQLEDEVKEYYRQLLRTAKGHQGGQEMWDRIHFIVPECLNYFGQHKLSLSSLLQYSPMALRQVKNIIGNRPAVLVPHIPFLEDMAIADHFGKNVCIMMHMPIPLSL